MSIDAALTTSEPSGRGDAGSGSTNRGHARAGAGKPAFELFVARRVAGPRRAVVQVRRLLETLLPPTAFDLTVIDVQEQPDRARQARVLATPTLIRRHPGPEARIVGDLSDPNVIRDRFLLP